MSLLQEFAIEIPDAEADEIKTIQQGQLSRSLSGLLLLIFFAFHSHRLYCKNTRRFANFVFCVVHYLFFVSSLREGIVLFVYLSRILRINQSLIFTWPSAYDRKPFNALAYFRLTKCL